MNDLLEAAKAACEELSCYPESDQETATLRAAIAAEEKRRAEMAKGLLFGPVHVVQSIYSPLWFVQSAGEVTLSAGFACKETADKLAALLNSTTPPPSEKGGGE